MTKRGSRILAVVIWIAAVIRLPGQLGEGNGPAILFPSFGLVGLLLTLHRPLKPGGWLLLLTTAVTTTGWPFEFRNGALIAGLAVFFVLFPADRPPTPRWWIPVGLTAVGFMVLVPIQIEVKAPNGFGIDVGVVIALAGLLTSMAAPVVRYVHGSNLERAQLKWLGWAVGAAGLFGSAALILAPLGMGDSTLGRSLGLMAILIGGLLVPVSIAVALFRYRLYDIDRIISRSAAYSILVLVLGSIYALIALGPTLVIGTGNAPDVVIAAATLACAALFAPLRRWLVGLVDRRFNRSKYQGDRELEALSARLRSAAPGEAQREAAHLVDRTLHPATISFWVRQ